MKKTINRVGLSWIYDYIKLDLINSYNSLKSLESNIINYNNINNIDINIFREVDYKLAHLAKVFYMLNIHAGVFLINEFRLSLNFIVGNISDFDIDKFKQKNNILYNNIENIMNYIDDIIQGYGDLPIYYVKTIDQLRIIQENILFSQCSYIVNSVKQQNIADYPISLTTEAKSKISSALINITEYSNQNFSKDLSYDKLINNINIIKTEFKNTQHYLLWDILSAIIKLDKNYVNYCISSDLTANKVIKQIIFGYNNISDTIGFEKISKTIPAWIGSLCFCLIYSQGFNLLDKSTQEKILSILIFHARKSLANYMSFVTRMEETDGWILVLDIASELDLAIERLGEIKRKKRADISWLLELLQKHIDSCILTGTYEVLEDYYNCINNINEYTISGNFISGDDLEKISGFINNLINNTEAAIAESRISADLESDIDEALINENNNLNEIKTDSEKSLYNEQVSDLNILLEQLDSTEEITIDYIINYLNKILNIFKLLDFTSGINIIKLYSENINKIKSKNNLINLNNNIALKNNIIVFIKYTIEVIKALYIDNNYITYVKMLKKQIDSLDIISIYDENINSTIDTQNTDINNTDNNLTNNNCIINIFFEEADKLLEAILNNNAELNNNISQNSNNINLISNILTHLLRDLHTLKGSSRMVSLIALGDLVHYIEDLFKQTQDNIADINSQHINTINKYVYQLRDVIISYKSSYNANSDQFIKSINNLIIDFNKVHLSFTQNSNNNSISIANIINKTDSKVSANTNNLENNSLLQIRQSIRVNKDDYEQLLDQVCSLVINQQQLSQSIVNYNNIYNQLHFLQCNISSNSIDNSSDNKFSHDIQIVNILTEKIKTNNNKLNNLLGTYNNNITAIFDKLFTLRMIPLKAMQTRLAHLVKTVSTELNKNINFNIIRSEGLVDSFILEHIAPCIDHIIRNAIYHGIEDNETRISHNKTIDGNISLEIFTENNLLNIIITDDGSGINKNGIINTAKNLELFNNLNIDHNIIDNPDLLNADKLLEIITSHGFTTAQNLSYTSGRGIGLDVVKNTVANLSGILKVNTEKNKGTSFTIQIPSSLTKQKLVFIKICDLTYAIPELIISKSLSVSRAELNINKSNKIFYQDIEIYNLYNLLNLDINPDGDIISNNSKDYNLIIIDYKNKKYGFIIDKLLLTTESIVRPLSYNHNLQMQNFMELVGVTVTNDGDIVLVLDIISLLNKISSESSFCSSTTDSDNKNLEYEIKQQNNKENILEINNYTILAVEDSATLRHIISNYIEEKPDYKLITAVDGLDALEKLKTITPSLIILDISMPRMNGLEFLKVIRKEDKYLDIPVIITTSREEEAFKELAMQLNVDIYLKKPYDKTKLLNAIDHVMIDSSNSSY